MKSKSLANKIISEEGLEIYYWVTWDKDLSKEFVVLHPGSSMNHSSLQNLEQKLNENGFPTIVLDPRGFGFSYAPPKPEYFKLEKYSNDLKKILEKEGIEHPSFVGHSFGFMPIIDYVAQTSNAKDIIGVCASYNFSKTAQNKLLFHLFNRFLRYFEYAGNIGTQTAHFLKGEKRTYPDQSKLEGKSDLEVWLSIADVSFREIKTHIVSGIEINKWDITPQLKKIENPLLLIYGSRDPMVKEYAGKYIASLVKGETSIEVIEGTHSLPITDPEKVWKVMKKYGLEKH